MGTYMSISAPLFLGDKIWAQVLQKPCVWIGTDENCFYNLLSTFGSKLFLTLKIMDFEIVSLTKLAHIYVIEGMNV
jgi:hypothetical protein